MKGARIIGILAACSCLFSCSSLVNSIAFRPDTVTFIPDRDLPEYVHRENIRTSDSLIIQGLHFSRTAVSPASRLILYFHGNAGNLYGRMGEAGRLFATGCDVLLMSYRGYAQSQGKPSEAGVYIDGKSAFEHAVHGLGYSPGNIVIYGRSIGTAVAVETARGRDIRGLILITPLTSGFDLACARGYSLFSVFAGSSFDSLDKMKNVRCPLLVIHGDSDEVIPFALGVKLHEAYGGPKKMVRIAGGGHNDLELADPGLFWSSVEAFMKK